MPLEKMSEWDANAYKNLNATVLLLESLKRDVQDVEFTIQDGKLYVLQTRNAKRSAIAAVRIAVDMRKASQISMTEMIERVSMRQLDLASMPTVDPKFKTAPKFTGIPACSGVVKGRPVFSRGDAIKSKTPCILITHETTPDDIGGMQAAQGIVTMVGGLTSHAAVVARSMNRSCIVGVGAHLTDFESAKTITMCGATGRIWFEDVPVIGDTVNPYVSEFKKIVCTHMGIVPAFYGSLPKGEMFDEVLLYIGNAMTDVKATAQTVIAASKQTKRLYLDLTPATECEKDFMSIFSAFHFDAMLVGELVKLPTPEFDVLTEKIVMVGSSHPPFKTLGQTTNLESVVMADGVIAVMAGSLTPAMKKVMGWKKAEGVTLVSLGGYDSSLKSILSAEQALLVAQG
jgi:phosphohistidine swiveling domain-containing protein